MNNNYLTIRAVRNQVDEEKDKNDKVIRRERHFGEFVRQFYVDQIKEDEIEAKLEDGVLRIHIPKQTQDNPPRKRIEIQ